MVSSRASKTATTKKQHRGRSENGLEPQFEIRLAASPQGALAFRMGYLKQILHPSDVNHFLFENQSPHFLVLGRTKQRSDCIPMDIHSSELFCVCELGCSCKWVSYNLSYRRCNNDRENAVQTMGKKTSGSVRYRLEGGEKRAHTPHPL